MICSICGRSMTEGKYHYRCRECNQLEYKNLLENPGPHPSLYPNHYKNSERGVTTFTVTIIATVCFICLLLAVLYFTRSGGS